jgi:xylan 1,4-beta-xylosidase
MKKGKQMIIPFIMVLLLGFISAQAANYTLAVNAGTKGAAWNRFYERCVASCHAYTVLNSAYGRNISNALKKAHAEAGFQYLRCHGIMDADVGPYVNATTYNWANVDKIYDSVVAAGMRPEVEISFMPPALASGTSTLGLWYNGVTANNQPPSNWTTYKTFITAFVTHLESRYGVTEVRNNWLFEIWNEPDWMYTGLTAYLTLYDNTVQAIIAADPNVRVGGPAQSGPSSLGSISTLVNHCKTNNVKLDFVSWHRYANDNGYSGSLCNANSINDFAKAIADQIKTLGFTGLNICDEWGPTYNTDRQRDDETSASFAAKTIHLLSSNGTTYPPPYMFGFWTISDIYEEMNVGTQTAFREGNYGMLLKGAAGITQSYDVAKPIFNAFKLLHKLNAYTLTCTGGTTNDGVNACATISANNDTVSVLIYNHYNGGTANSGTSDNVSLTISGIAFTNARVEHFVVDKTHSNSYQTWVTMGKPAQPSATQWTTLANSAALAHYDSVATTTITGGTFSKTFTQNYYSVGLIQITNQNAVKTIEDVKNIPTINTAIKAQKVGTNLLVSVPTQGQYTVQLFSTSGKKMLTVSGIGPGNNSIPLNKMATGSYLLKCSSAQSNLVMPVVVER